MPGDGLHGTSGSEELSRAQVSAFRLSRHHLLSRAPRESLAAVAGDICGVQAQLMSAAQIALWARVQDLTPEDVEQALWQERILVKTWCMRGTVHLLPAVVLPVYAGALKRSAVRAEQRWMAKHGATKEDLEVMARAVVEALAGVPLTRRELALRVAARLGPEAKQWVEHSWGGVVKQACLQGLACFGPDRGKEITFVRQDQWLSGPGPLSEEEAGKALLRGYLRSYGPATLQDFAAWTGMAAGEAASIRNQFGDEVIEVSVEGRPGLTLREDLAAIKATAEDHATVRLLPSFDAYLLGHRDKSHLVDKEHYKLVYRKAGWLSPVVLSGGRAIGIWSQEHRGRRLRLKVELFEKIASVASDQIEAEAKDLGRFLGTDSELAFVGPD